MNDANRVAGWIIGVPLVLATCVGIWSNVYPEVHRKLDARNACEHHIKAFSGSSSAMHIGRVSPASEGAHFLVMHWTPSDLQLKNRLGELVGQSATCAFNTRTHEVERFSLL